jgi:cell division protein ZipA
MEDLRYTLLILGGVVIIAILVHGIWTIRKNAKANDRPKFQSRDWQNEGDEPVIDPLAQNTNNDSYDDVGVGPVRIISGASAGNEQFTNQNMIDSDEQDEHQYTEQDTVPAIDPEDPLVRSEDLAGEDFRAQDFRAQESIDAQNEANDESREGIKVKTPELDESLSLSHSEMDFAQLAAEHEEAPTKLYGSVVTQPKPEFKRQARPSETSRPQASETSIPEPPPFLLKPEAATPPLNTDEAPMSPLNNPPVSNEAAAPTKTVRPEVDSQGRVEPEFKLDAEEAPKPEEEKPISLAAQARKLVSRRKKSVADKIRKEPQVQNTVKANEEQMRIDFTEESASHASSNVEPISASRDDARSSSTSQTAQGNPAEQPTDVLVLNVRAPEGNEIIGSALLPMLLTLGFKFGEQDIFHRHVNTNGKGPVLFSLANLFKPGVFDIDNIENFSTRGLSLFMMLPIEGEPQQVFNMMHNAARKLADEFGCQILDGSRGVLTKQGLQKYSERIREFERKRINRQ